MSPKNQEKGSRRERAKYNLLLGLAAAAAVVGGSELYDAGSGNPNDTHVTAEPNRHNKGGSIFCTDPKVVETVNVTASQIINYDTPAEIGKLPNIKKLDDINKIEFAYDHDVIQNPQEAWDFRDAAAEYFGRAVVAVSARAGATATGQIAVYACQ